MNRQQRLTLLVTILASFVAFLDSSVVTVALPAIAHELGGGFFIQQWTVDAYLITLGALMLIAGAISDNFGRKRVLVAGLVGFLAASLLCAAAPNGLCLIIARALQGVAGALLVPSSLALIISTFKGAAQSKAIGLWTAWTGVAYIVGPLLGGLLVDVASWRLIFAINVLPIGVTLCILRMLSGESYSTKRSRVNTYGAILCAVGLGGTVFALIEQARFGWANTIVYAPLLLGVASLTLFMLHERHTKTPMLPLILFSTRNFSVGNVATFVIYGGLAVATFLITLFIQQVGGYTAVQAGLALLPVTVLMFFLSPRMGALAGRYGPRFFMSAGPIVGGISFLYMLHTDHNAAYWSQVFPAVVGFGLGLSITVAPLTSAILGAVDAQYAGIASAFNNAVARVAGLVAIAALGLVVGPELTTHTFHQGVLFMALLLIAGGVISAVGIQNNTSLSTPPVI